MSDDLAGQLWFLRAIAIWFVAWAALEHLRYRRRLKRDKYADLNEGR